MAEMTVRVEGVVQTSTGSSGTGGSASNPSFTSIAQGGNVANVAVPGPNLGAGLVVSSGTLIPSTTLNAATATGPGTVADFGSAKQTVSLVWFTTAGITAGAVALEVSQDNTNWFRTGTPVALTASAVGNISIGPNAFRYARANITTTVTGGTVSATLMGA